MLYSHVNLRFNFLSNTSNISPAVNTDASQPEKRDRYGDVSVPILSITCTTVQFHYTFTGTVFPHVFSLSFPRRAALRQHDLNVKPAVTPSNPIPSPPNKSNNQCLMNSTLPARNPLLIKKQSSSSANRVLPAFIKLSKCDSPPLYENVLAQPKLRRFLSESIRLKVHHTYWLLKTRLWISKYSFHIFT